MTALDVHLHDALAGKLERLDQARLRFTYAERAVDEGGGPLSLSLPLRPEPFEDVECRPFFGGLLPEGDFLRAVGRAFGVAPTNAFAVLAAIVASAPARCRSRARDRRCPSSARRAGSDRASFTS